MSSEFMIAVHALVFLHHQGKTMTSEEIAKNVCTNPARIRKVLVKLKKAGLVETKEGAKKGGYRFVGIAKDIHLLMIHEALQKQVIQASWHSGDMDQVCLIASNMATIMDAIVLQLDEACKEKLANITIQDIDTMIFKKGNEENERI